MNPLTFKGIRSDGRHNVAVFEDFNREFSLDESNLYLRISILEKTHDVSAERTALSALLQRNFTDKLSTLSSPDPQ
jgi:hypothetical protein